MARKSAAGSMVAANGISTTNTPQETTMRTRDTLPTTLRPTALQSVTTSRMAILAAYACASDSCRNDRYPTIRFGYRHRSTRADANEL